MTTAAPLTDVHTHIVPSVPDDVLALAGLTRDDSGTLVAPGGPIGPPDLYHPNRLQAWLKLRGLDRALVSVPPPLYRQGLSESATRLWIRALNDGLSHALDGTPELLPLAYLPLDQPAVAVEEAERLIEVGGLVGATGAAGGRSISLADERHHPLFALLAQADMPLLLHPGTTPDHRMEDLYLHNLVGNPVESTLAGAELLLGGVLERFPALRVALVHAGGVLPSLIGRLQRGIDAKRPGLSRGGADLRKEARMLWADSLSHDEQTLALAEGLVGSEHVLLGSDWPFPMGCDDPMSALAHLPEHRRDEIAGPNAAAFIGETPRNARAL